MHYIFFILIDRLIVRAIIWFTSRKFPYSEMYSLTCGLKCVSAGPTPGTRQGLDWISVPNRDRKENSKSLEVHYTPPHYNTNWTLDSLRNFARSLDLDLMKAWLCKEPSNIKIIRGIRRYNISEELSRIIFYKLPFLRKVRPTGFQLPVQLKIRNFVY